MLNVVSLTDFNQKAGAHERVALLLYKPANESCECALQNIQTADSGKNPTAVFVADVSQVRDIHPEYQITSVPSLLIFEKGKLLNIVKGCHESMFFKALLKKDFSGSIPSGETKKLKQVTVYSTPTCSWCNTLKSWLKHNNINFRDVDISRDEKAAQDLIRRSGQQGVPQTDINGQIVVGFDQARLKSLLELN
ncbi:MAG: glutaredoxin domain-containing protein [Prolixibacteraceae bacterium]|jgi:glutaredoxin-like YruB-family protein